MSSLSKTRENMDTDMEAITFESTEAEIGEIGASCDVGDKAMISIDSDIGVPDVGNTKNGVEEPHIDDLTDEIGSPEQEQADVVAEEPVVGVASEKDDECGALVGEPGEESRNDIQEAEDDNSGEGSKAPDDVDCSPNDGGNTIEHASFERKSRSALRGRERKQRKKAPSKPHLNDAIRIRGDSFDTKGSTSLVKNNRPSHGGDALKSNDNTGNLERASKKERARVKKGKTNKYKKKSKDENVKAPEERTPDIHNSDNDGGSFGGGIDIHHRAWTSWFVCTKIDFLLLISTWTLLKPAGGAAVPPSSVSYRCCTFEALESKIAFQDLNFTIKYGVDDICTHKPYADTLDCTTGSVCFLINKHVVKLCNKANNGEAFTLVHGLNWTTIHSSNPEELSPETVEFLRIHYAQTSPTTSASPDPTSNYNLPIQTLETRSRVVWIAAVAAVAITILLFLYVSFRRCRRGQGDQSALDHTNEDRTAEKENDTIAQKEEEEEETATEKESLC